MIAFSEVCMNCAPDKLYGMVDRFMALKMLIKPPVRRVTVRHDLGILVHNQLHNVLHCGFPCIRWHGGINIPVTLYQRHDDCFLVFVIAIPGSPSFMKIVSRVAANIGFVNFNNALQFVEHWWLSHGISNPMAHEPS